MHRIFYVFPFVTKPRGMSRENTKESLYNTNHWRVIFTRKYDFECSHHGFSFLYIHHTASVIDNASMKLPAQWTIRFWPIRRRVATQLFYPKDQQPQSTAGEKNELPIDYWLPIVRVSSLLSPYPVFSSADHTPSRDTGRSCKWPRGVPSIRMYLNLMKQGNDSGEGFSKTVWICPSPRIFWYHQFIDLSVQFFLWPTKENDTTILWLTYKSLRGYLLSYCLDHS